MPTRLKDYIEKMRSRHPRLSLRGMAVEAGLAENAVYKAVNYDTTPRPAALKALADTWGRTPAEKERDYKHLMRFAGYLYEPATGGDTNHFEALLSVVLAMRRDEREQWAWEVLEGFGHNGTETKKEPSSPVD